MNVTACTAYNCHLSIWQTLSGMEASDAAYQHRFVYNSKLSIFYRKLPPPPPIVFAADNARITLTSSRVIPAQIFHSKRWTTVTIITSTAYPVVNH